MGFYKEPIIEKIPECIVCSVTMYDKNWNDGLVCSATCNDLWLMGERREAFAMDWEDDCV